MQRRGSLHYGGLLVVITIAVQATYCSTTSRNQKTLDVVWNVPTSHCTTAGVLMLNPERYGIRTNVKQETMGPTVNLFYKLGRFPVILTNATSEVWLFGGLPQNGNLVEHLEAVQRDIDASIPDKDFDGIGVIDFEEWRPVWSMATGTQRIYRLASIELVRREHPDWKDTDVITREAASQFEQAGRRYMLETLSLCQRLRPRGKWGYYGYPLVDNYAQGRYNVSENFRNANDEMSDLFRNSTAVFPSIYVLQGNLTSNDRALQVRGRILETFRVLGTPPAKVFVYFWFGFHDAGPEEYMTQEDLRGILDMVHESDVDGMVIWGDSIQVNSSAKCERLKNYLDNELGPMLNNFANNLCSNFYVFLICWLFLIQFKFV